jgi:hypothetical protein
MVDPREFRACPEKDHTSLNDLVLDAGAGKLKSLKLRQIVATQPL